MQLEPACLCALWHGLILAVAGRATAIAPRTSLEVMLRKLCRWNDATSEQLTEPLSPKTRRVSGGLLPPKKAPTCQLIRG